MGRVARPESDETLLDLKLRELALLIKDLHSEARVEISFERYEDENAHLRIHLPPEISEAEVQQVELAIGQRCTEILLETGLFVVGAVYN